MKREFPLYPGDTHQIILAALQTVGISPAAFISSLRLRHHDSAIAFRAETLTATDWLRICKALYLSADCISYGYFYREHKAAIRRAIDEGRLNLPISRALLRLRMEILRDRWADYRWQMTYYGFRLRWRIRRQIVVTFVQRRIGISKPKSDLQRWEAAMLGFDVARVLPGLRRCIVAPKCDTLEAEL